MDPTPAFRELRAALRERDPAVEFRYERNDEEAIRFVPNEPNVVVLSQNFGVQAFVGTAATPIESAILPDNMYQDLVERRDDDLATFVQSVVELQRSASAVSREEMVAFIATQESRLQWSAVHNRMEMLLQGRRHVFAQPGTEDYETVRRAEDLAIFLMLRFGAFRERARNAHVNLSDGTMFVIGVNLAVDFLLSDDAARTNAQASIRRSMHLGADEGRVSDHVTTAGKLLHKTNRMETSLRAIERKRAHVLAQTWMLALESVSVMVLAITMPMVVWWKGGLILATNRVLAWIATITICAYVLGRMAWLHIPRD